VHVQLAERRVAVEHPQRRMLVEVALELLRGAVADSVAARLAREQAGAGEGSEECGRRE